VSIFEGCGVDFFMVEMFYDLEEFVDVIEVVCSVLSLLIVVLMIFDEGVEMLVGVIVCEVVECFD